MTALRKAMVEERVPAAATVGVEREGDLAERPVLDADGNETAGRTADASRSGGLRDLCPPGASRPHRRAGAGRSSGSALAIFGVLVATCSGR